MDRIKEIWKKLITGPAIATGIQKIRYSEKSLCDLYLGIKVPENSRVLAIRLSVNNYKDINGIRNIKGLRIEKIPDLDKEGFLFLNLVLSENRYQDIFDILVADIISNVIDLTSDKEIIKGFYNRLNKWQSLFEKFNPEGLSQESQRGLFGELVMLRKLISETTNTHKVILCW